MLWAGISLAGNLGSFRWPFPGSFRGRHNEFDQGCKVIEIAVSVLPNELLGICRCSHIEATTAHEELPCIFRAARDLP